MRTRLARSSALLLAVALVAAGCGGGDADATVTAPAVDSAATAATDPAAAGTTDPATAGTTPGTTVGASGGVTAPLTDEQPPGVNEISSADAKVGATVKVSATTPKKFKAAHCAKPIMVIYHQPDSIVDEKLLAEGLAAAGTVDGTVVLQYTPKDVREAGDLPAKLGLFATPGIATVGRDGKIRNFWTTYVDRALIQLSLRNAAAAKPCKVGGDDVPSAGSALQDAALVANGGTPKSAAAGTTAGAAGAAATGSVDPAMTGSIDPLTGAPIA